MPGALEGDAQIVLECRHARVDLDRARDRAQRLDEVLLADGDAAKVVHRPRVARVEHDRPLERLRRAGGIAELVLHPAEQPIALVGRRVESQCRLDFRQRFLRLALVEQDAAQVETALDVGRVLLDRLPKRAHGLVAVARLPGREAEHVIAPHVVGLLARVRGEQPHRLVVMLPRVGALRILEGHRSRRGRRGRGRDARRLG